MSHGAVTIINATATGRGCSLATDAGVHATWDWADDFQLQGAPDDKLARACLQVAKEVTGQARNAHIAVRATMPPARGLKTSSSAAAAMLEAAGIKDDLERHCVAASRAAGVTLTGAFDDQVAVVRGGCHLTENARQMVVASFEPPCSHVAVWVPDNALPKSGFAHIDASAIAPQIKAAEDTLRSGDVAKAMTMNGRAFTSLYHAAGLPITMQPADVALAHGALGSGLSGTGPAVAALFDAAVDLPSVAGGTWQWHRTVAA